MAVLSPETRLEVRRENAAGDVTNGCGGVWVERPLKAVMSGRRITSHLE